MPSRPAASKPGDPGRLAFRSGDPRQRTTSRSGDPGPTLYRPVASKPGDPRSTASRPATPATRLYRSATPGTTPSRPVASKPGDPRSATPGPADPRRSAFRSVTPGTTPSRPVASKPGDPRSATPGRAAASSKANLHWPTYGPEDSRSATPRRADSRAATPNSEAWVNIHPPHLQDTARRFVNQRDEMDPEEVRKGYAYLKQEREKWWAEEGSRDSKWISGFPEEMKDEARGLKPRAEERGPAGLEQTGKELQDLQTRRNIEWAKALRKMGVKESPCKGAGTRWLGTNRARVRRSSNSER